MSSKNRAEKEQSWEPPSVIPALPEDVIVDILARVPRYHYPTLSLVSKQFRSLVASPELYAILVGLHRCLHVFLSDGYNTYRLCILRQKANGNRSLVLIHSLPAVSNLGSLVTVGSRIYVFGGIFKTTSVMTIDCRSHTVQLLPNMHVPMCNTTSYIIDGRIYLIGNSCFDDARKTVMVVFNTETKKWDEPRVIKIDIELGDTWRGSVVMAGKTYTRDFQDSFVYDPKKSTWETDEMLNSKDWENACVVDDLLYYYDSPEKSIRTYVPRQTCWGVLKDVGEFLAKKSCAWLWSSKIVSYGEKLALLFSQGELGKTRDLVCGDFAGKTSKRGDLG